MFNAYTIIAIILQLLMTVLALSPSFPTSISDPVQKGLRSASNVCGFLGLMVLLMGMSPSS